MSLGKGEMERVTIHLRQEGLSVLEIQRRLPSRGDRPGFISAGDLSERNLISAFLKPKRGEG